MDDQSKIKIKALKEKLADIRVIWGTKLTNLIELVEEVENIPTVQVQMLGYRHDLNDLIVNMSIRLQTIEETIIVQRKDLLIKYKTKSQINLDKFVEMDVVMHSDLSVIELQKKILESQRNFYKDSRDTIDKLGFAIKNRIQIYSDLNI